MKQESTFEVAEISAQATWHLRQMVMYPTKPLSYVQLENDAQGKHFGIKKNNELVSVVSLFLDDTNAQFRKLATLPSEQKQGLATTLLTFVEQFCTENNVKRLWCNARQNKRKFYEKLGFEVCSAPYQKGELVYVTMQKIVI